MSGKVTEMKGANVKQGLLEVLPIGDVALRTGWVPLRCFTRTKVFWAQVDAEHRRSLSAAHLQMLVAR